LQHEQVLAGDGQPPSASPFERGDTKWLTGFQQASSLAAR
jgi:hypothetical protein